MWSHMTDSHNIHTTLWPLKLFNCFLSLSRHLTENTVFLNLHHHGNLAGMSVWVWLTQSLNHAKVGRYTPQAVVTLFKSAPHEHCTKDSLHNVWHELHFHTLNHPRRLDFILLTYFFILLTVFCFHEYKTSVLCVIVWVPSFRLQEGTLSWETSNSQNTAGHP